MSVSAVESDGLAPASQILALTYGDGFFGAAFHELNGLLYSDGGGVLDPATHAVLGHYVFRTPLSDSDGVAVGLDPDSSTKRVFAAYDDPAPTALLYTLQSFDLTRSTDGLAFIGQNADPTAGQFSVHLIHGSFVAP